MSAAHELLEPAAKAAGYEVLFWADKCAFKEFPHKPWNPRDDDGDSRRLEVALRLTVEIGSESRGFVVVRTNEDNWQEFRESWDGDPGAATRFAVLRAAAEVGRAML